MHVSDLSQVQENISAILARTAPLLREAGVPDHLCVQFDGLAEKLHQACVVAVVGPVKAGKSTFVNALLGQDLATVGTTETTATINRFRYGHPARPDRPVRCHWRSGQDTDETLGFLHDLQGHDEATLRRASEIDYLEYSLVNPYLECVTLVDTPGTGAVVREHEQRTSEFLGLPRQLRDRHDQETQRIRSQASAVIYLTEAVATAADRDTLEQFREVTQDRARALNAIGVMAKIDLNPDVLERRAALAARISAQLVDSLNTVVPVSAAIQRALDRLGRPGLVRIMDSLRQLHTLTLDKLLADPDLFLSENLDCPLSLEDRREVLGEMEWGVFRTIARVAADPAIDAEAVEQQLRELAGFDHLHAILERHFFRRSQLLTCFHVVREARDLLRTVRDDWSDELRRRAREDRARRERFLSFIQQAGGDRAVAREFELFVREQLIEPGDPSQLLDDLERDVDRPFHALEEHNADFEALTLVEDNQSLFSDFEARELEELRALFGLYGMELEKRLRPGHVSADYVSERQHAWLEIQDSDRHATRSRVADLAVKRYGRILDEMQQGLERDVVA